MKTPLHFLAIASLIVLILLSACQGLSAAPATETPLPPTATVAPSPTTTEPPPLFSGQNAYDDVITQLAFGPRIPGTEGHDQAVAWMRAELEAAGWSVEIQESERMGHPIRNVIARRGSGTPWIILGAHYDSRMVADSDPDVEKRKEPVPGGNDGASGVAVLLELARVLPKDLNKQVWLTLFDAEDQGNLPGWDWILGSRVVADSLEEKPDAVIIVDMIGDQDQNIHKERNSDPELNDEIWSIAADLGYGERFINSYKFSMIDDHTPFLEKGIRAIDIIDFDYPYWHTTEDTADKVSPESLEAVGRTLEEWLVQP